MDVESVCRFILFEFLLQRYTLSILMNEYRLFSGKKVIYACMKMYESARPINFSYLTVDIDAMIYGPQECCR
jgi:hypothetical protein